MDNLPHGQGVLKQFYQNNWEYSGEFYRGVGLYFCSYRDNDHNYYYYCDYCFC